MLYKTLCPAVDRGQYCTLACLWPLFFLHFTHFTLHTMCYMVPRILYHKADEEQRFHDWSLTHWSMWIRYNLKNLDKEVHRIKGPTPFFLSQVQVLTIASKHSCTWEEITSWDFDYSGSEVTQMFFHLLSWTSFIGSHLSALLCI